MYLFYLFSFILSLLTLLTLFFYFFASFLPFLSLPSTIFICSGLIFDMSLFSFHSLFHPHTHTYLPLASSPYMSLQQYPLFPSCCLLCFPFSVSHFPPLILSLFYLFFPLLQPCVAVLQGTLCSPQPLSAVLRVLLLWLRLFLYSSTTTTTLYYPPLPTSWQVFTLCTACLSGNFTCLYICQQLKLFMPVVLSVYQLFCIFIMSLKQQFACYPSEIRRSV